MVTNAIEELQMQKKPISDDSLCCCKDLVIIFQNKYCFFTESFSEQTYHTNHIVLLSKHQLNISSSQLPQEIEKQRQVMSLATSSPSQLAVGLTKVSNGCIVRTKQAMRNAGRKDIVSIPTKNDNDCFTNEFLSSVDNAEGLKKILHHYGYKVLKITHKQKENEITMNIAESTKLTSDIRLDDNNNTDDEIKQWLEEERSSLSNNNKDLLCIAWASQDMIQL
jgi:hypothetical protein